MSVGFEACVSIRFEAWAESLCMAKHVRIYGFQIRDPEQGPIPWVQNKGQCHGMDCAMCCRFPKVQVPEERVPQRVCNSEVR